MKRVYLAGNLLEAQLIADTLAGLSIANHIFNANAVGATGELPFSQTWPEVWVVDDTLETRARDVIATLDTPASSPDKVCPHCGEHNPGNFLSCWQCGSALAA